MQGEKTENLQSFALRLRGIAGRARLKQAEVARRLDISPSRVGNWFQGLNYPSGADAARLAKLLNVPVDFLLGVPSPTESTGGDMLEEEQAPYGGPRPRFIPVISWTHAGDACAYEQIPLDQAERVATFSTDARAFAVEVEGESMLPDFKPGDRVIVTPSREPRNGRPVVAKLADDGVVLRIYTKISEEVVRLASLRPEVYPSIDYKPGQLRWVWPVEELSRKI